MTVSIALFAAGLLLTIGGIVVRIAVVVGRMELKVDAMWDVFMNQPPTTARRGRRRSDRSILALAHDRGQAPKKPHD